jgi:nucleoside-diphosphate-sugar epimerase
MSDRHVLITGGAGYIGSFLTSELLRANYQVTILDSLLFGGESLIPFLHHPNFHFVKADVTDPRAIKDSLKDNWQKPDAIVHLAAIVGFPACQAVGKQVAWRYNVEATEKVF